METIDFFQYKLGKDVVVYKAEDHPKLQCLTLVTYEGGIDGHPKSLIALRLWKKPNWSPKPYLYIGLSNNRIINGNHIVNGVGYCFDFLWLGVHIQTLL